METSKHALYDCMTEFNFHHTPCNFQTFIDSKLNTKTKTMLLKDILKFLIIQLGNKTKWTIIQKCTMI